jgi:hypothetical protein
VVVVSEQFTFLLTRVVKKGTAHSGPGLGLRNRAQRLFEYGERRAFIGCAPPSIGRKRRREWDVVRRRLPNAVELKVIFEEEEEEERVSLLDYVEQCEQRSEMDNKTVVFQPGTGGHLRPGYAVFYFIFGSEVLISVNKVQI